MQLRNNIDYKIEPHIISIADYENDEMPFVVEVKNTGIKAFHSDDFFANKKINHF